MEWRIQKITCFDDARVWTRLFHRLFILLSTLSSFFNFEPFSSVLYLWHCHTIQFRFVFDGIRTRDVVRMARLRCELATVTYLKSKFCSQLVGNFHCDRDITVKSNVDTKASSAINVAFNKLNGVRLTNGRVSLRAKVRAPENRTWKRMCAIISACW